MTSSSWVGLLFLVGSLAPAPSARAQQREEHRASPRPAVRHRTAPPPHGVVPRRPAQAPYRPGAPRAQAPRAQALRQAYQGQRYSSPYYRPPYQAPRTGAPPRVEWSNPARHESASTPQLRAFPEARPIADPNHFVRRWAPPPEPKLGPGGAALGAKPFARPPYREHAALMANTELVNSVYANQHRELTPNHYYWHHDGGRDYVHVFTGGIHWYGFYAGQNYYWSRYHAGHWWWYDSGAGRYVYYADGYWWWQDPALPQVVYVYENNAYVPYDQAAAAPGVWPNTEVVEGGPGGVSAPADNSAPPDSGPPADAPAPGFHSDVDAPTYALKKDPNRIAIVIGVENYADLPKADFAARDAAAVRAHLAALGYADRNVVLLTDNQAARASVAKYVESWLPQRVTKDSSVFVYFSGHGAPDPTTGAAYVMPWDGDAKYLADTGYPLKRLYAKLNELPADQLVVVLDSCFSGAGGRSVMVAGARPLVTKTDVGRGDTGRVVVFSASGSDEITGSLPDQGHGLFTYYFLKGLNGEAVPTPDGVTVQALYDYLSPNVEDAARRDNRDQTPQLIVPPDGRRKMLIKDLR